MNPTPQPRPTTPTDQPQTTTTWELEEFIAHQRRLQRVSMTVARTTFEVENAISGTQEAYGMLFGWAVMPFMSRLSHGTRGFADTLEAALEVSAQAIKRTREAYADEEAEATQTTSVVTEALTAAAGKVLGR